MRSTAEKALAPSPAARQTSVAGPGDFASSARDRRGRKAGPPRYQEHNPGDVIGVGERNHGVVEQQVTVPHLLDDRGRIAARACSRRVPRGRHDLAPRTRLRLKLE
ncbi:MAG TPA: hypothetical protein VGZ72_06470 [Stellaceae bacterium]|nr:hypothetical protein [Stellaceae bacterium]